MTTKKLLILDATLTLAMETGIDGLSTLNVANQAGVAKATLFHHFKTKAELIDAVYLAIKSDFDFFAAPADEDINHQFEYMWRHSLSWALDNAEKLAFLNMYYIAKSVPNEQRVAAKKESIAGLYERVQVAQTHNNIPNESTEVLTEAIYAHFMSTASTLLTIAPDARTQYIDDSVKILLRIINHH